MKIFVEFLYLGYDSVPLDLTERICVLFDAIAEFLRQNAITTASGLVALMCAYRISAPDAERKSYVATSIVILLSTLSVSAVCAFAFYGLKLAWESQVHQVAFAVPTEAQLLSVGSSSDSCATFPFLISSGHPRVLRGTTNRLLDSFFHPVRDEYWKGELVSETFTGMQWLYSIPMISSFSEHREPITRRH